MTRPIPRAPAPPAWEPSSRAAAIALAIVTLCAALLRLVRLDHSPPGLNQDEAISAWIGWCLLKVGQGMSGEPWPVFYCHGVGDNPSTLFFYVLMPFQKLGGLNVWTTRLPSALSGILCVPLIAYVGSRMFGRTAGLVAAAMLAVNPWHVTLSRLGIGAGMCPLFALGAVALLLRARFPLSDGWAESPRPAWAFLAGLFAGIACYGFHPMKIYFPALFLLLAAATAPAWRSLRRSRGGLAAVLMLAIGFGLTFGPLAWQHWADPAIARRWEMTRLWEPGTPLPEILRRVLGRYFIHFGPDFLFVRGDRYPIAAPPDQGEFEWALLPLMLIGLAAAFRRARTSASSALLLALVLAYPVGDLVSRYNGVHAFRSSPGLPALVLLAAWGAVSAGRWLSRRSRVLAWATLAALALGTVLQDGRCIARYFGSWPARPVIYHWFHADLMEACAYLRPRLRDSDSVFWTVADMNMPFAMTLVGLRYDPRRWLSDEKDVRRAGGRDWYGDWYVRYGRMYFLYGQLCRPYVEALQANGRKDHVYFVVRPRELGLKDPVHVIRRPDGKEALWICEGTL